MNRIPGLNEIREDLNIVYDNLIEAVRARHHKEPKEGHDGLLELAKAAKNNLNEDRGIKFNRANNRELFDCLEKYKGDAIRLTEKITIILKTGVFVHILIGHVEKHLIPRKGKLVQFSKVDHWITLHHLIISVIYILMDDLIRHYTYYQAGYDNTNVEFEGCTYGIHINKHGEIKTFYQIG